MANLALFCPNKGGQFCEETHRLKYKFYTIFHTKVELFFLRRTVANLAIKRSFVSENSKVLTIKKEMGRKVE